MSDAILDQQRAMNGQGPVGPQAPRATPGIRTASALGVEPDGTPRVLAAILIGSLATLVLLRLGGFRFSFGANIGGGR